VVSTATGKMVSVLGSGGEYDTVAMNGASVAARHYVVNGDKRQEVWLDNQEIPIKFRTMENGTAIDFVLRNATAAAGGTTVAALKRSTTAHSGNGDR